MNKTTTTYHDLLRYASNETNLKDADRIQRSIDGDPVLRQEYREITDVLTLLDEAKAQPSEKVISNILEFSVRMK